MGFRNSPPSQPVEPPVQRQPRLTVPREQLAAELAQRGDLGRGLRARLGGSHTDLRARRQDYYSWHEYNDTLLRQRFDQPGPAKAYSSFGAAIAWPEEMLQQHWQDLAQDIDDHVRRLESLRERLPLFDVVPSPTAAARNAAASEPSAGGQDLFIVHGHDGHTKTTVARFLHQLTGRDPVILHERPDGGRTIIEKFEAHAEQAAAAVVLLTGDDVGGTRTGGGATGTAAGPQQPRARQNVVLELGFFLGRLGRAHVIILYEPGVELPSDLAGVLYVEIDAGGLWKNRVARELKGSGVDVDLDALLRA